MMKEGTCIFWFCETFVPCSWCKLFCFVMGKGSSKRVAQVVRLMSGPLEPFQSSRDTLKSTCICWTETLITFKKILQKILWNNVLNMGLHHCMDYEIE